MSNPDSSLPPETMRVKSQDKETQGDYVVINKADFNPKIHEAFDGDESGTEVKASKAVKEFAEENEVDLSQVTGTGKDGAITKKDVEKFIAARTAAQ